MSLSLAASPSALNASSAIGRGMSSVRRNARAAFGVSTIQCETLRATSIVRAGSTACGGTAPSRLGTRYSAPLTAAP